MFKKKDKFNRKKNIRPEDMEDYYDEGDFWDKDSVKKSRRGSTFAWTIAGVASLISLVSVFGISQLASMKTVIPYVIEVDRLTGEVQVKKPLSSNEIPQYEALSKFFINKYLLARLGYDRNDFNYRYETVVAMSSNEVANTYAGEMATSNKKSPVNVYGERGIVKVHIKNISFIEKNLALVRLTEEIRVSQGVDRIEYNATVSFEYSDAPLDEETRLITPLGFIVNRFRKDPILIGQ